MRISFTTLLFFFIILKITGTCAQNAGDVHSKNKEANAYYLRALDCIKAGNPRAGGAIDSLVMARQLLEKAVEKDSLFLDGYIELCRTYVRFDFSYPNFKKYQGTAVEFLPKAKKAILKAIQIDSTSSTAYSMLAGLNLSYEYKWDEAIKNLAKAIHFDPENAANYASTGKAFALKGQWEEAQKWMDKAYAMSPKDSRILLSLSNYYYWKGDYQKADYYLDQINPQTWASDFFLGINYLAENNAQKAEDVLRKLYPDFELADGGSKSLLAYALILNGKENEGRKLLARCYELNQVVPYRAAACYVALKEYDKAIELLEEDYGLHGNWMIWLKYDRAWDPLRNTARFRKLIAEMKFE